MRIVDKSLDSPNPQGEELQGLEKVFDNPEDLRLAKALGRMLENSHPVPDLTEEEVGQAWQRFQVLRDLRKVGQLTAECDPDSALTSGSNLASAAADFVPADFKRGDLGKGEAPNTALNSEMDKKSGAGSLGEVKSAQSLRPTLTLIENKANPAKQEFSGMLCPQLQPGIKAEARTQPQAIGEPALKKSEPGKRWISAAAALFFLFSGALLATFLVPDQLIAFRKSVTELVFGKAGMSQGDEDSVIGRKEGQVLLPGTYAGLSYEEAQNRVPFELINPYEALPEGFEEKDITVKKAGDGATKIVWLFEDEQSGIMELSQVKWNSDIASKEGIAGNSFYFEHVLANGDSVNFYNNEKSVKFIAKRSDCEIEGMLHNVSLELAITFVEKLFERP